MQGNESVTLNRDVDASVIPIGTKVTLQKGEQATITQSLGGSYTVVVNGKYVPASRARTPTRWEWKRDAKESGLERRPGVAGTRGKGNLESIAHVLRSGNSGERGGPRIEFSDCHIEPMSANSYRVGVKMTLTAPGCGMGPVLQQDVQNKLLSLEAVDDVSVELVWDPPWNQSMLSEAAKLQLGLM